MDGGLIKEILREPDGISLDVCGVGCHRFKKATIKISATNYRLRIGDLVWWQEDCLRWEGKRLLRFERVYPMRMATAR